MSIITRKAATKAKLLPIIGTYFRTITISVYSHILAGAEFALKPFSGA